MLRRLLPVVGRGLLCLLPVLGLCGFCLIPGVGVGAVAGGLILRCLRGFAGLIRALCVRLILPLSGLLPLLTFLLLLTGLVLFPGAGILLPFFSFALGLLLLL